MNGGTITYTLRRPSPKAIQAGLDALAVRLNADTPGKAWTVSLPPERIDGTVNLPGNDRNVPVVVAPDDADTILDTGATRGTADEDEPDHATDQVA